MRVWIVCLRSRIDVLMGNDGSVMSNGGLRSERRLTLIERSAPGASFCRFGRGREFLGRIYWVELESAMDVVREGWTNSAAGRVALGVFDMVGWDLGRFGVEGC